MEVITTKSFKVYVDATKTRYTFRFVNDVCTCCNQQIVRRPIRITYKMPRMMTIFESNLIAYAVYNILSEDVSFARRGCPFHQYTDCKAGKEWLANIEKVEIL